jgi:hypothetical protein
MLSNMERNAKIIESLIGENNSVKITAAKFNVQRSFVIRLTAFYFGMGNKALISIKYDDLDQSVYLKKYEARNLVICNL